MSFIRLFSSELLKLKRTLALWMVVIAPTVVNMLYFLAVIESGGSFLENNSGAWQIYSFNIIKIWALIMLPLFITLETALLSNMEYADKQWKHLFALPVRRGEVYAVKWVLAAGLMLLSSVCLWAGEILSGLVLRSIAPTLGFSASIPFLPMLQNVLMVALIDLLVLSIQLWISLRWSSFTLAVGVGMSATVANIILIKSDKWSWFFPWSLVTHYFSDNPQTLLVLALGAGGGLLAALLGGWNFARKEVV
jgi:hypothetical protein